MSYVTDSMRAGLAEHKLRQVCNSNGVRVFRMAKPGTGIMGVDVVFAANRIGLTGDIILGHDGRGLWSDLGYGVGWFSGRLSERYLCEKFLRKVWVPAVALDALAELHREYPDRKPDDPVAAKHWAQRFVTISGALADTAEGGAADVTRSAEAFADFWMSVFDGDAEYPGHDYDPTDAGWLCAIQQRFCELWKERVTSIEKTVAGWVWIEGDTTWFLMTAPHGEMRAHVHKNGQWHAGAETGLEASSTASWSVAAARDAARASVLRQAIEHPELWHIDADELIV